MDKEPEKNNNLENEDVSESQLNKEGTETSDPENASDQTETGQENLSKKIKETYSQNEDWQDKYMRVLADLENLKRRQIKEREDAVQRTRSQIFGDLLPALDAFQMGIKEVEKEESTKNIFIGISMAYKQMEDILGEYGLEIINPEGTEFDPKFHEALSYQTNDEVEDGYILQTVRTGYKIRDKLLRPASVIISQGKEVEQS
ncbi:MAG: nucleotide exchange factor GrpE [Verrucomicrobiota bacterium]|nr:nucleotide exchange factor GrpE [Verrucomicrobiota bacterium]|tara:strand:- start:1778 stop:2383 length:606 start_codon:yes stop_codon:yes gene_type:complete